VNPWGLGRKADGNIRKLQQHGLLFCTRPELFSTAGVRRCEFVSSIYLSIKSELYPLRNILFISYMSDPVGFVCTMMVRVHPDNYKHYNNRTPRINGSLFVQECQWLQNIQGDGSPGQSS
jgi:hypothetical protein